MGSPDLTMLLQQKQTKLQSFEQQKAAVEGELNALGADVSAAEVTLGDKKMSLSEAVVTLSNFTIPDVIDQPDRSAFTSVDAETGEEVFDEAAFNAENDRYLESVRVHDEAVKKKAELEAAVDAKTQEVAGAETSYTTLVQTAQSKENELAAIDDNMNISMSEIEDLNEQIRVAEQQEAAAPPEPETKVVKGKDGLTRTYEIDPETGKPTKETVTDANGNVIKTREIDSEDPSVMYIQERRDDITIDTVAENGTIKSKFATSDAGNVAEYDGHGNTKIIVKAGESPDVIYNKFYGGGEDNAQNRENLVEQFRQKVRINGQPVPADYQPTDAQLRQYFYQTAGFEVRTHNDTELFRDMLPRENERRQANGLPPLEGKDAQAYMDAHRREVRLKGGGILQAGQELSIPTEIHPDDVHLQNRDAETEKARGNAAEAERKAKEDALRLQYTSEQQRMQAFKDALLSELRTNAGVMNSETSALNRQGGSHPMGNAVADYHNEQMQNAISGLDGTSSLSAIAGSVEQATGNGRGTLSVTVSEQDLNNLYHDMQRLASNPDDKELAKSVQDRWDSYTMRNFVGKYNEGRAENNMLGRVLQNFMIDSIGAANPNGIMGNVLDGSMAAYSSASSAANGDSFGEALLNSALSFIPYAGTIKSALTEEVATEVYKKMGNSSSRVEDCFRRLGDLNQQEQRQLAKMLEGKTAQQQAAILAAYSRR